MPEYFIVSNSFSAPFVSETSYHFVEAESPHQALFEFAEAHLPYSANIYKSANDYHKMLEPLFRYICNLELAKQEATKGLKSFTYENKGSDKFVINGNEIHVDNPREGIII